MTNSKDGLTQPDQSDEPTNNDNTLKLKSFHDFYEEHRLAIFQFVVTLSGHDHDTAEDITQEVFFEMWKKWDNTEKANIKYLIRSARNRYYSYLRKGRSYRKVSLDTAHQEDDPDQPGNLEATLPDPYGDGNQWLKRIILAEAFNKLKRPQQEVIALRLAGFQFAEIGEALGIDPKAAHKRYTKGMSNWQKSLIEKPEAKLEPGGI